MSRRPFAPGLQRRSRREGVPSDWFKKPLGEAQRRGSLAHALGWEKTDNTPSKFIYVNNLGFFQPALEPC